MMKSKFIVLIMIAFLGCKTYEGINVDLSQKKLKDKSIIKIKNIRNTKFIDLSDNNFNNYPRFLSKAISLEKLFLGRNKIDSIPASIGNLKNLRTLDLSANPLVYLSPEIGKLKKLKYVLLRGDYKKKTIENFRKLFCNNVKIIIYTELPNPYGLKNCN